MDLYEIIAPKPIIKLWCYLKTNWPQWLLSLINLILYKNI